MIRDKPVDEEARRFKSFKTSASHTCESGWFEPNLVVEPSPHEKRPLVSSGPLIGCDVYYPQVVPVELVLQG